MIGNQFSFCPRSRTVNTRLYKTLLVDALLQWSSFGTPCTCMHFRSSLRTSVGLTEHRSRRSLRPKALCYRGWENTSFVLVLLYLRYPLPIYPSCDPRVRVRYPLPSLCNRRAASVITSSQLKTELAELRLR